MKKNIKYLSMIMLVIGFCSCDPQEDSLDSMSSDLGTDMVERLNPTANIDPANSNNVIFTMDDVDGLVGVWNIGGTIYPKNVVSRLYDWKGTYEVEAYAYNKYGTCPPIKVQFEVPTTNPELCDNQDYYNLTGGCDALNGKTWILDSQNRGYYGLGSTTSSEPDWWPADPGSHNGVYDDEITFVLNEQMEFKHETHGTSGIDSEEVAWPAYTASWYITLDSETGFKYIELTGEGFFPPRSGDSVGKHTYKLIQLTEDVLVVAMVLEWQAWFYRFVPKT